MNDELRQIVGDDLHAVVEAQGLSVVSVSPISPLGSSSSTRAAFRLDLADGSSVKGRRFESALAADRAHRLGRCLPSESFPRILAQHGRALLTEWVEGERLSARPITSEHLHRMGELLSAVHEIVLPEEIPAPGYPGPYWRQALGAKVERLCAAGELEPLAGAQAMELAVAHAPERVGVSLVHADLCPENVAVDAQGNLHVVDNDSLALHAPAYDLARTWYRWPMTNAERQAFEEGYNLSGALRAYHHHFVHWAVVVLIGALEFRFRRQLPGASEPLRRLREILECHAGHGSPASTRGG
jgi:hypothetical protein